MTGTGKQWDEALANSSGRAYQKDSHGLTP